MKNVKFLFVFAIACALTKLASSQLYMSSSGSISLGSTSAAEVAVQSFGTHLFCSLNSFSGSAPVINVTNGSGFSSALAPDYGWFNDSYTGIFHPAGYQIGFSVDNYQVMNLNAANYGEVYFYNSNTSTSISPWATANYVNSTATVSWLLDYYNGSTHSQNFYVYGSGNAWSYGWHSLSDARLKQNIDTIHNALGTVIKLCGVTYNWNPATTYSGITNKRQMGLIAQEVQKVVPEVVDAGKDSVLGIAYQNLIPLLIEALKQEDNKVNKLQNIVDSCCNLNQNTHHNRYQKPGADSTGSNRNSGTNSNVTNITLSGSALSTGQTAILYQNIPNPFSTGTKINYYLPEGTMGASIVFYDMYGGKIKEVILDKTGAGTVKVTPENLANGVYSYSLIINSQAIDTKKMILSQ